MCVIVTIGVIGAYMYYQIITMIENLLEIQNYIFGKIM